MMKKSLNFLFIAAAVLFSASAISDSLSHVICFHPSTNTVTGDATFTSNQSLLNAIRLVIWHPSKTSPGKPREDLGCFQSPENFFQGTWVVSESRANGVQLSNGFWRTQADVRGSPGRSCFTSFTEGPWNSGIKSLQLTSCDSAGAGCVEP